jgi:hypothetical protein
VPLRLRLAVPRQLAASPRCAIGSAPVTAARSLAARPRASRPAVRLLLRLVPLPRLALLSRLAVLLLLAANLPASRSAAVSPAAASRVAASLAAVPPRAAAAEHQGSRGPQAISDLFTTPQRNGPLELSSGPFSFCAYRFLCDRLLASIASGLSGVLTVTDADRRHVAEGGPYIPGPAPCNRPSETRFGRTACRIHT